MIMSVVFSAASSLSRMCPSAQRVREACGSRIVADPMHVDIAFQAEGSDEDNVYSVLHGHHKEYQVSPETSPPTVTLSVNSPAATS